MSTAIIGTGFMARVHAEALARIGVPVLGVVGSSPERAAATGLAPVYESVAEALADDRVTTVHVCSPNHLHSEQALAALRACKHVVCEKPLAMTSEQARELRDVATGSGLVHAVCFINRFYPLCGEAAARVASGSVGSVRLVTGGYLQDWLSKDTDWNWRLEPDLGGSLRVVGDIGSHWLDLVSFVTGHRVEAVMADLTTLVPERRRPLGSVETFARSSAEAEPVAVTTEDVAGILLRFEGGARGVLSLSQVSPGRKNHLSFDVSGSESSLGWGTEDPERLWIGNRDGPNQIQFRDAGDVPAGHAQGYQDTFKALFRAVYAAIDSGGAPATPDYPTFDDGLEQALVADAIDDSARHGRWATVRRGT
ncbi:Gfo/Idh/MocA family protein [Mycolicibacterium sediminis]|uniref:Dehydrogenase n=1 Tax=Mycolicibacterium sediminis TaxID=1286180 RepID=A0A7I7QU03_9MYCO|nr:Gfo/Idh/MocA family oxidoreductase [Mycolicibacterium sediminis]BBY29879.1 dehydrogenase [Mycolicibacterium sediminis]